MDALANYPQLLEIGSTGRNSGKTFFAKDIILRLKDEHELVALKIITIKGARGVCQRGEAGCGICTSIDQGYELIEEKNARGKKDTMEMLKSGCKRVFMLKAFEDSLMDGFQAFMEEVGQEAMIICESNSLRNLVIPGQFVMIDNQKGMKKSAQMVIDHADFIIETEKVLDSKTTVGIENHAWVQMSR